MSGTRQVLTSAAKERGYAVLTLAATATVLLSMVGLCVDLGRVYVAKNELQSYVDMAALTAVLELDGTSAGLTRATQAATSGPTTGTYTNKWNFSTTALSGVECKFATSAMGTYTANPGSATGIRFVQVNVTRPLPLYFLPILPNVPSPYSISVRAVAGQGAQNWLGEGADPFSPDVLSPDPAADFGFEKGGAKLYTIKWAPPGQRDKKVGMCNGDLGSPYESGSEDRGYIDVGQGTGNAGMIDTIVDRDFFLSAPLTLGSTISVVGGNKSIIDAMLIRLNQDTDIISETYAEYEARKDANGKRVGNGRRVLTVPVNFNNVIIGFAAFFMPNNMACFSHNTRPCCAEFVGSAVWKGSRPGGGALGPIYVTKLFQ